MILISHLLIDIGVLIILFIGTITIHFGILNLSQGQFGLHIFTSRMLSILNPVSEYFTPLIFALLAPPILILTIGSWIVSELFVAFGNTLYRSDVIFICGCFCFCLFVFIAYYQAAFVIWVCNFDAGNEEKPLDRYYKFSWEDLDRSLTPAIVCSLFMAMGMLLTYLHHSEISGLVR